MINCKFRFRSRETATLFLLIFQLSTALSFAQTPLKVTLPKPDTDGWIRIFRGNNQGDFAVYTDSDIPSKSSKPFGAPFYVQSGDTLRTSGSPDAQLIFKQNFSHYIAEVELRWPGALCNTGMLTKIQWDEPGQSNALPTSVECQGDPNQGMGQIWSLGPTNARPWITVHGKMDNDRFQADSTKPEVDFGGSGDKNCIVGYPGWAQPRPAALNNNGWVKLRVENHGKDTAKHFVNDVKVIEYRNPRIAKQNNANDVVRYLTEGMLSVQSEGGEVWYRNWRIKLLPADPLYASLYVSTKVGPLKAKIKTSKKNSLGFNGTTVTTISKSRKQTSILGQQTGAIKTKD